ncbi:MAG: oligogalacturonate lyase family protein [Armatimonadota bacterium]
MARGDTWPSEIEEYVEDETGARVKRLTGSSAHDHHLYFTSTSFTGDGERIVFGSHRSGSPQLHMLQLDSGQIVQLTDSEGLNPQLASVHPEKEIAYVCAGRQIRQVRLDTFEEEVLYECPEGFRLALPTITADGSHLACAYQPQLELSTETGVIYSTMQERFFRRPACVVMRIETESGEALACWGEHAWISHVCIHPHDPDLIMFCHEGRWAQVQQRMWTVDVNETPAAAHKLYHQHCNESVGHEYFTQTGEVGFQCSVESGGQMLTFDCFIRPDGTWIRQYRWPGEHRASHIQSSSDNSLVIGDGAYLGPEDDDGGNWMGLITHEEGVCHVRRLCRHDTSWETQMSHPHPIFSPDDRWVLFTSDRRGKCDMYMAEVIE